MLPKGAFIDIEKLIKIEDGISLDQLKEIKNAFEVRHQQH